MEYKGIVSSLFPDLDTNEYDGYVENLTQRIFKACSIVHYPITVNNYAKLSAISGDDYSRGREDIIRKFSKPTTNSLYYASKLKIDPDYIYGLEKEISANNPSLPWSIPLFRKLCLPIDKQTLSFKSLIDYLDSMKDEQGHQINCYHLKKLLMDIQSKKEYNISKKNADLNYFRYNPEIPPFFESLYSDMGCYDIVLKKGNDYKLEVNEFGKDFLKFMEKGEI